MQGNCYLLEVDDYRAIKKAKIALDRVTVIAGPNGSGKSTISHIVHSICNMSIMYPQYLTDHLWGFIEKLVEKLKDLGSLVSTANDGDFSASKHDISPEKAQPDFKKSWDNGDRSVVVGQMRTYAASVLEAYEKSPMGDASRAYMALKSYLDPDGRLSSTDDVLHEIYRRFDEVLSKDDEYTKNRQYAVYNQSPESIRKWLGATGVVRFSEGGNPVYATRKCIRGIDPVSDLKRIYGITRAIFVASPLVSKPKLESPDKIGFNDGFVFAAKENQSFSEEDLFSVMKGSVSAINDDKAADKPTWTYTRSDGLKVDLDMCATGLISFSILQTLCRYSLLDEGTLLIVDEPEAHLHPKWIVEYVRVLMELVKRLKVRLLIATHSPYFLNAVEKLAPSDGIGKELRFYEMVEVDSEEGQYESRDISSNLESVYKSMYDPLIG